MDKLLYDVELMDGKIKSIYKNIIENRDKIEELIHDMVESKGGIVVIREGNDDEYCYISYDGGNHPEYASTLCAFVNSVRSIINHSGKKTFDVDVDSSDGSYLEDTYDAYRMNFDDLVNVFDFVKNKCYGEV